MSIAVRKRRKDATAVRPARKVAGRTKRKDEEHKLQVEVLNIINVGKSDPDIFAFAIPNAGRRSWRAGMRLKAEGLTSGVADVCVMLPESRSGWLELKEQKRGKQSTEQKGFEARCRRLGHPYELARSVDEAVAALRRMGVLR